MKKPTRLLFMIILVLSCIHCSSGSSSDGTVTIAESDFEETTAIAENAENQFTIIKQSAPTPGDARQQLVSWLLTQEGVTEAGIEEDDKTVWFYHTSGMTSGVLTENSFINGSSAPLTVPETPFSSRESVQGLSPAAKAASTNTGMTAWLLSPFYTENSSDDKIYSLDDFYELPGFGQFATPIIDGAANIAAFQAALIGFLPPAVHFTVISHGGRTRLKKGAQKISFVVSGEYKTAATWSLYGPDFQADRLIIKAYKGKLWLCMTPAFFEYYSGKPDPEDSHWMARYVHLLVCYSYRDNGLHDAFMNNGAQAFSGFTHGVDIAWGNNISVEYFQKLAEGEGKTIAEARGALSATDDPNSTKCKFEHSAKTTDTRYFYRASVVFEGSTYLTPAYGWISVFHDSDTGYFFSSSVYHENTGELGGVLTVIFDSTTGGNVATTDTVTEIRLDTTSNTWWVDHGIWEVRSNTGIVEATTFNDINGGQVIGSFYGSLNDSLTGPVVQRPISGNFELIRSFN
jgi:hypothetical protein